MTAYLGFTLLFFGAFAVSTLTVVGQHKYYVRTVRRLAREHNQEGRALVSGRAKGRFRGAIAVLVLRTDDETIAAASAMEGTSVLARFKDRPDWIGLRASSQLPRCSRRLAKAVADARTRIPTERTSP